MDNPRISVIVPVYNAENYIQRCVDSILSQTFTDFELILINDGSRDTTLDICNAYLNKDSRVRVMNKQQGGVSSARNLGLENAKGEWITFIDADDWIEKDYLGHLMSADTNADIIVAGFQYVNGEGEQLRCSKRVRASLSPVLSFDELFLLPHLMTTPWGKLYRMGVIRTNCLRFNERMKMGEDTCFVNAYLCHVKNLVFVEYTEYKYLFNPGAGLGRKYKMSTSDFLYHYTHIIHTMEKVSVSLKTSLQRSIDNEKKFFFNLYIEILKNLQLSELKEYGKQCKELNLLEYEPLTWGYKKRLLLRMAVFSPLVFYVVTKLLNNKN